MMKQRDIMYEKKVKNPLNLEFVNEFKRLKNKVNNKIKSLKNLHFRREWDRAGSSIKKQWGFINSFFNKNSDSPMVDSLLVEGMEVSDNMGVVNSLNKHFAEIGETIVNSLNNESLEFNLDMQFTDIECDRLLKMQLTNENEVNEILLGLKKNSAPGDDEVTVLDLLNLREHIVPIITTLINTIISSGIYPQELKISRITPIFKSGDKKNMGDYRPISVISVFSKIIEKIMKKQITEHVNTNISLDKFQYGFITNSNTLGATFDFVNYISKALDEKKSAVAVFIDLKKAFDVVSVDLLLNKLYKMGIRGKVFGLIETYLRNRRQYVKLGNVISDLLTNNYGVPQGSVLGPLLYALYVLSLRCANLKGRYFTFADDTALVYTGKNEAELMHIINDDLNIYVNWLFFNKLKINAEKTKYILFRQKNKVVGNLDIKINNESLEKVEHIRYLGLIIDEMLSWQNHINKIKDKILPMIPAVYKFRNYLSAQTKMNIYNAFFLSHFRYLIPVWGTCCQNKMMEMQKLQNKILKILFNFGPLTSTQTLYGGLGVGKLETVFKFEQSKLIHKIVTQQLKSNTDLTFVNEIHTHNTRALNDIYLSSNRTNLQLYSPIQCSLRTYNLLPVNIRFSDSYRMFLKKLKEFLGPV